MDAMLKDHPGGLSVGELQGCLEGPTHQAVVGPRRNFYRDRPSNETEARSSECRDLSGHAEGKGRERRGVYCTGQVAPEVG